MPSYNIERWDPVIPPGNTQPFPMIYIKPDEEFIKLAQANNYNLLVTIDGTGKQYDKVPMVGVVDSSGYFPDYRPNFYNNTKLLVLTLMCDWIGYGKNGTVSINGLEEVDKFYVPCETPKPLPWNQEWYTKKDKPSKNFSNKQIVFILLALLTLLTLVRFFLLNSNLYNK